MSAAAPGATPKAERAPGGGRPLPADVRARIDALLAAVRDGWPGFVERPGQRAMIDAVAATLLAARGKDAPALAEDDPRRGENLLVVEGRTGTGKTLGYLVPLVAVTTLRDCNAIVATATVSLQEQLVERDLPRLAALSPFPFAFSIMKGRGRYLCRAKLDVLTGDVKQEALFDDLPPEAAGWERPPQEHEVRWLRDVARRVDEGAWNGDRDALDPPPAQELWTRVAADRHGCTGAHCHAWRGCSFFAARREARAARIVVANHDLVLSTLAHDAPSMQPPEDTLFVFDEAHHLPDIGIAQFTERVALEASLRWLDRLPASLRRSALSLGESTLGADATTLAQSAAAACRDLQRAFAADPALRERGRRRFPQGTLPGELLPVIDAIVPPLEALADRATKLHAAALRRIEDASEEGKATFGVLLADMGAQRARLDAQLGLWRAWKRDDAVPLAKWVELEGADAPSGRGLRDGARPDIVLAASPITAAGNLARHLWRRVGAAVATSATIAACGDFDYFRKLAGLRRFPAAGALAIDSPFDYARQGTLVIPAMRTDPGSADAHTDELALLLPERLRHFDAGQLVLFASRRQMERVAERLPADLRDDVLVQGSASRGELLKRHAERVRAGRRSVLFGMQSFGEGLDLPGALCEHVAIAKIPFSPPDGPVEEALSEWLAGQARDPFAEIAVPRAGLRLTQWVGRGIRTVDDRAEITIYDRRLVSRNYGGRILKGLPPFALADLGGRR